MERASRFPQVRDNNIFLKNPHETPLDTLHSPFFDLLLSSIYHNNIFGYVDVDVDVCYRYVVFFLWKRKVRIEADEEEEK